MHSSKEITSDERKTLTKISTCNFSQQFPQTSTHIRHNKIRNKQTGEKQIVQVAMQKRLKEAFAVARHLTSQEAARQRCYYDCKAGAVALQPGDVVMVRTDGFVGKIKVKDRWEDGGFIVESQLEDWPVYKVRCPTSDAKQKPKYHILHRNCLLLVTNEDNPVVPGKLAQAKVSPVVLNATPEAAGEDEGPSGPLPSLLTRQEGVAEW